MDRNIYILMKLPGMTETIAKKLIAAGITDIKAARAAEREALRAAGLKASDADKIKRGERK